MRNFKNKILTYKGNTLKFDSMLSYPNLKTYKNGNDRLVITSMARGQEYRVEIVRNNVVNQLITVHSRRGVYAVLTYYEILGDNEEVEFINSQYGSLQHYLDDVCTTSEYISEKYNIK